MSEFSYFTETVCRRMYVKVRADYNLDGTIRPVKFRTEDGPTVVIDEVQDVRQAASTRAGGQGTRYTCRAGERRYYLFFDRGHWFVERLDN